MIDQITIADILQAFEELMTGAGESPHSDPLKMSILNALNDAGDLTLPELVEILLEREITQEEERQLLLGEPAEGTA